MNPWRNLTQNFCKCSAVISLTKALMKKKKNEILKLRAFEVFFILHQVVDLYSIKYTGVQKTKLINNFVRKTQLTN